MKKICTNKQCQHNGILQPIENFYIDKRYPDNHSHECTDCKRVRQKKWNDKANQKRKEFFAMYIG